MQPFSFKMASLLFAVNESTHKALRAELRSSLEFVSFIMVTRWGRTPASMNLSFKENRKCTPWAFNFKWIWRTDRYGKKLKYRSVIWCLTNPLLYYYYKSVVVAEVVLVVVLLLLLILVALVVILVIVVEVVVVLVLCKNQGVKFLTPVWYLIFFDTIGVIFNTGQI